MDGDTRVYRVVIDEARPDTGELEHDLTSKLVGL
jgi:hypothetical protein